MMSPRSVSIQRFASVAFGLLTLSGCAAAPPRLSEGSTRGVARGRVGRPGYVVAAAPGADDRQTDAMAAEIARRTGFGLLVGASDGDDSRVRQVAQGPVRFYAELQASGRPACAGQIEIATVGVDRELAQRLRTLAELIRDAHLRARRQVERLDVRVAPADDVPSQQQAAERGALGRLPERALHIELPRCGRRDWRDAYTAILAEFLTEAVTLPVGR
jgi:hypothetical protein